MQYNSTCIGPALRRARHGWLTLSHSGLSARLRTEYDFLLKRVLLSSAGVDASVTFHGAGIVISAKAIDEAEVCNGAIEGSPTR